MITEGAVSVVLAPPDVMTSPDEHVVMVVMATFETVFVFCEGAGTGKTPEGALCP